MSSPPSTDVVDFSYRWRPPRHGRGAEADPTAAREPLPSPTRGEQAGSWRFSSRSTCGPYRTSSNSLARIAANCVRAVANATLTKGSAPPAAVTQAGGAIVDVGNVTGAREKGLPYGCLCSPTRPDDKSRWGDVDADN